MKNTNPSPNSNQTFTSHTCEVNSNPNAAHDHCELTPLTQSQRFCQLPTPFRQRVAHWL